MNYQDSSGLSVSVSVSVSASVTRATLLSEVPNGIHSVAFSHWGHCVDPRGGVLAFVRGIGKALSTAVGGPKPSTNPAGDEIDGMNNSDYYNGPTATPL